MDERVGRIFILLGTQGGTWWDESCGLIEGLLCYVCAMFDC